MQTDNFEKQIVNKLKNRTLIPSDSAWERLSNQLDEVDKQKRKRKIRFLGYAASLLVLVSASFLLNLNTSEEKITFPEEIIVSTETKEEIKKESTFEEKEEILAETQKKKINIEEDFLVKNNKESIKNRVDINKTKIDKEIQKPEILIAVSNENLTAKKQDNKKEEAIENIQIKRIRINADDLLYAVTHSPEEVKSYYAKYNINRNSIIDSVQQQLKKSNLKIDPETILAEVELSIEESDFQQNFMDKFKSRLSEVIVAIADRNN